MASYLQKLRPKAKQNDPANFRETVVHNAPNIEEATKPTNRFLLHRLHQRSASQPTRQAPSLFLTKKDERFLERLAAIAQEPEGTPPPLPGRPAVIIDEHGQQKVGKERKKH